MSSRDTGAMVLVSGLPRAGKSSFADAVEESPLGLTHVPMDRYIMEVPPGKTFLQWVREPSAIDWDLLVRHLDILRSGRVCYTPRPDWKRNGRRICEGGAVENGPGRRLEPCERGYIIPGTHIFSMPQVEERRVTIYIDTPDEIIAARFAGRAVAPEEASAAIREYLEDNDVPLRPLREQADLVIGGTWERERQVTALKEVLA